VICFGALSHLVDAGVRDRAVQELVRVAKDRAPLFISVINRFGVIRVALQRPDLRKELVDPAFQATMEQGVHRPHPEGSEGFPDAAGHAAAS